MSEENSVSLENVEAAQVLENAFNEKAQEIPQEEPQVQEEAAEEKAEQSPEEKDEFASKFAALSRKEKALRQREQEMQARIEEMEAQLKAKEEPKEPEQQELPLEYRLKNDPLGTLDKMGLSYDKLTQLVLNDGKLPTDMQMELMRQDLDSKYGKEIEALKNQIEEREKAQEEAKYQETIDGFKYELNNFIDKNNEKYELISANNASDLVFEVIENHFKETEKVLSNEEAADAVEEYLLEEAKKLAESKKLKSIFGAAQPKPEVQERKAQPTLSNTLSSQSGVKSSERFVSDEQSKAEAARLLKWES